ncbi:PhlD [Streptomyces massasporeus]|uniref:PhlD n=1 Tax=Streptomyces massasporeus TaxID=67324 RepID=UPI001673F0DE|nr:PhlD [Streptomyces massasporeus]GGV58626.1 polyketide synthase-like Pks10 [Streptomyces massasporeus]
MTVHVAKPVTVMAGNKVTTAEICAEIRDRMPEHPRLGAFLRCMTGSGVATRYFSRPLAEVVEDTGVARRSRTAFADACDMAVGAARSALAATGLAADDIDAIVTSHTTSWTLPNLDTHLVEVLGLRPDVSRIALTSLACAGGAQALVRAADLLGARPGGKVLVVVAEVLSTTYHAHEDTIESMIYKVLFGDSAGACVVSDLPLEPGFAIESTFEYVLPDSLDRYWGEVDAAGAHFRSTRKALGAPREVLPAVLGWLGSWRPDFAVVHPGGPRIISEVTAALGLGTENSRHSFASLEENGNLGGNAVLDVLGRSHATPPPDGAEGLIIAFGPGFAATCARGVWRAPTTEEG